jgi:hypothetical protein
MANTIYPKCKEALWKGLIDLSTATVKAVLIDLADYAYNAAHEFLSDVPSAARVATSPALTTKTFTNGVFDADDTSFATVTGDQSEAVIFFVDTGSAATSRLICFDDTGITGAPVTPNGGNINLAMNASGIAAL